MPVVDKDFVVRLIHQIGELFARIVKLVEKREYDQALKALHAGCPSLLGIEYQALTFGDAESTARMLVQRDKIRVFAQLVAKEAELLALKASPEAEGKQKLALELWAEALLKGSPRDVQATEAIAALREVVDVTWLAPRHQSALESPSHVPP